MNSSKEEGESLQAERPVAAPTDRRSAVATEADTIRQAFQDSSLHEDQSRPRAFAVSQREKPKFQCKKDQACALVDDSNLSDDPTGLERHSSGFESPTESDERLSITPDRVETKKKVQVIVNTAGKEIPETGCIAQFWNSKHHLERVPATRGINPYMATVLTPAWPYVEMVHVKLYDDQRVIGIGAIYFVEPSPPLLFVFGNQVKYGKAEATEIMQAVLVSPRCSPSLPNGDGASSVLLSSRAVFTCRSDDEEIIYAYSRLIFDNFPQRELPRPEMTLPELQARLKDLVHVVHNTEYDTKDASGLAEGLSKNVHVDAADPLYDTVSEEIGDVKENNYESLVFDVARGNGLELRPQLCMSSETALKILTKATTGEISVDRAIEDANDYDTFKRLLPQNEKLNNSQSSCWKPWREMRRRREKEVAETTQSLSSTEKTDTDSLGRRQPKSWHGMKKEKDPSQESDDAGSLTSSDWNSQSLPRSYGRDRKTKNNTLPALNGKSESFCSKDSGLGDSQPSLGELPIRSAAGTSNRKNTNAPLPEIPQSEKSDRSC